MSHCFRQIRYGEGRIYNDTRPDNETDKWVVLNATNASTRMDAVPEYAEDGISKKYTVYTLTIETVIYSATALESFAYTEDDPLNPHSDWDIEAEMERVRSILTTPGLKLGIYPAGVGEVPAINIDQQDVTDAATFGSPPLTIDKYEPDTIGGPFPQECTVYPMGSNQAIGVKWVVQFHAVACRPYPSTPWLPKLLDYSYESDFEVDQEGDVVFSLIGTYHYAEPVQNVPDLQFILDPTFPPPPEGEDPDYIYEGMHLSSKITRSHDGRTLTITHKHHPIKSPSALPQQAHMIRGTDNIQSSYKKGFFMWTRTFDFEINLRNRIPKNFAYQAFLRIVQNRMKNYYLVGTKKIGKDIFKPDNVTDPTEEEKQKGQGAYLPTDISVTDYPYERKMRFRTKYLVYSSLDRIMNVSRIFERIPADRAWLGPNKTAITDRQEPDYLNGLPEGPPSATNGPAPLSDQWRQWALNTRYIENGYNMLSTTSPDGNSSLPIVVDVCGNTANKPLLHFLRQTDSYEFLKPVYDPCTPENSLPLTANCSSSNDPTERYNCREAGYDLDPIKELRRYSCDATISDQTVITNIDGEQYVTPFTYSPEAAFSWLQYVNHMSIIEDTSSLALKFLDNVDMSYYNPPQQYVGRKVASDGVNWEYTPSGANNPFNRRYDGLVMNGRTRPPGSQTIEDPGYANWKPQRSVSRGQSRFYVRMYGQALRWFYDIPTPSIISIGGQIAHRVGAPQVHYGQLTQGDMPINVATWDMLYTIDAEPYSGNIAANIQTNGVPLRYT